MLNRPGGSTVGRWTPLERDAKVAIRDTYQDWVFVLHWVDDQQQYGWVLRNALDKCRVQEGTP
jgi:hypothetical protein